MNLGLHDPAVTAKVCSCRTRLIHTKAGVAAGHRNPSGSQDLFCLVFVYFHLVYSVKVIPCLNDAGSLISAHLDGTVWIGNPLTPGAGV